MGNSTHGGCVKWAAPFSANLNRPRVTLKRQKAWDAPAAAPRVAQSLPSWPPAGSRWHPAAGPAGAQGAEQNGRAGPGRNRGIESAAVQRTAYGTA